LGIGSRVRQIEKPGEALAAGKAHNVCAVGIRSERRTGGGGPSGHAVQRHHDRAEGGVSPAQRLARVGGADPPAGEALAVGHPQHARRHGCVLGQVAEGQHRGVSRGQGGEPALGVKDPHRLARQARKVRIGGGPVGMQNGDGRRALGERGRDKGKQ